MSRRISFLIFQQFQLLDTTGPLAVFEAAEGFKPGTYTLDVRAANAGSIASSCGLPLPARSLGSLRASDTLLVAGGRGTTSAMQCAVTRRYLRRCHQRGARIASVCTGTFLLAAAGLLDGKAATTHWNFSRQFEAKFPNVHLQPDRIFVREGGLWSSAGVSAGIDLALALVTEDLGEPLARRVAQQLVVYYRRPGGQSQFSSLVEDERPGGRFEGLLNTIRTRLREPLTVTQLAAFAGMSPRNFSRCFTRETGVAPAKAVERVRAECARARLQSSTESIAEVAEACGFGDPERMRRSLLRVYRVTPATLRSS